MKTNRMLTVAGLAVLAVVAAGFNAKAQAVPTVQGKFTLSSEIRWGSATLAAGDYSFTLDHGYPGSAVTVRRGTRIVARIMTQGVSDMESGKSEIIAENGMVRALNLPILGVSLHYMQQRSTRRFAQREVPMAKIIHLTVTGNGR